eukprot:augustus_masked-scaffold_1-processed-gene-8.46-mRNA-1 protein AED:0.48 eAED:0.48 QI:0/-1/0/1/-1/1/1/0/2117
MFELLCVAECLAEENFTSSNVLNYVKNQNWKPRCGKVFSNGEFVYHCKTCQADDTCVFCSDCFKNSNHDGHDYNFRRTGPGGTCDCGDSEAWKPEGFCLKHRAGSDPVSNHERSLSLFTVQIAEIMFQQLIDSIVVFLTESFLSFERALPVDEVKLHKCYTALEATDNVDKILLSNIETSQLIDKDFKNLTLRLNNDDIHTYDDVSETILSLTESNFDTAEKLTRAVDKKGCATIMSVPGIDGYEPSQLLTALMDLQPKLQKLENVGNHNVRLLSSVVADSSEKLEVAAILAVRFFTSLIDVNCELFTLACQQLFKEQKISCTKIGRGLLAAERVVNFCLYKADLLQKRRFFPQTSNQFQNERVFRQNERSLKDFRYDFLGSQPNSVVSMWFRFQGLIAKDLLASVFTLFSKMVGFESLKTRLALQYVPTLEYAALVWTAGIGLQGNNLFDLGVQLLTVPSIIESICRDFDLVRYFAIILQNSYNVHTHTIPKENVLEAQAGVIRLGSHIQLHKRYYPFIHKLIYVLRLADSRRPDPTSIKRRCRALGNILKCTQYFHFFSRHLGNEHIEQEDSKLFTSFDIFLHHFDLYVEIARDIAFIVQSTVFESAFRNDIIKIIFDEPHFPGGQKPVKKNILSFFEQVEVPDVNVLVGARVTFALPIQRCITMMVNEIIIHDSKNEPTSLLWPLLMGEAHNFAISRTTMEILTNDVLKAVAATSQIFAGLWRKTGLQMVNAANVYAHTHQAWFLKLDCLFLRIAIQYFGLDFVMIRLIESFGLASIFQEEAKGFSTIEVEKRPNFTLLLEEFLVFYANIFVQRDFVVRVENLQGSVYDILRHLLAVKPRTFSEIFSVVSGNQYCDLNEEETISALKEISTFDGKLYSLREGEWSRIDPFIYRNSRETKNVLLRRKAAEFSERSSWSCSIEKECPTTHAFSKVSQMMCNQKFLFYILRRIFAICLSDIHYDHELTPVLFILRDDFPAPAQCKIVYNQLYLSDLKGFKSEGLLIAALYCLQLALLSSMSCKVELRSALCRHGLDSRKKGSNIYIAAIIELLYALFIFYKQTDKTGATFKNLNFCLQLIGNDPVLLEKIRILQSLHREHKVQKGLKRTNKAPVKATGRTAQQRRLQELSSSARDFIQKSIGAQVAENLDVSSASTDMTCSLCREGYTGEKTLCQVVTVYHTAWDTALHNSHGTELPPRPFLFKRRPPPRFSQQNFVTQQRRRLSEIQNMFRTLREGFNAESLGEIILQNGLLGEASSGSEEEAGTNSEKYANIPDVLKPLLETQNGDSVLAYLSETAEANSLHPKILFCGHSFHVSCLEGYTRAKTLVSNIRVYKGLSFDCPVCKNPCVGKVPLLANEAHTRFVNNAFSLKSWHEVVSYIYPIVHQLSESPMLRSHSGVTNSFELSFDSKPLNLWRVLLQPRKFDEEALLSADTVEIRQQLGLILGRRYSSLRGIPHHRGYFREMEPSTLLHCLFSYFVAFTSTVRHYVEADDFLHVIFWRRKKLFFSLKSYLESVFDTCFESFHYLAKHKKVFVEGCFHLKARISQQNHKTSSVSPKRLSFINFLKDLCSEELFNPSNMFSLPLICMLVTGQGLDYTEQYAGFKLEETICRPETRNEHNVQSLIQDRQPLGFKQHPFSHLAFKTSFTRSNVGKIVCSAAGDCIYAKEVYRSDILVELNELDLTAKSDSEILKYLELNKKIDQNLVVQRLWKHGSLLDIDDYFLVLTMLYGSLNAENRNSVIDIVRSLSLACLVSAVARATRKATWLGKEKVLNGFIQSERVSSQFRESLEIVWKFCCSKIYSKERLSQVGLNIAENTYSMRPGQLAFVTERLCMFLKKALVFLCLVDKSLDPRRIEKGENQLESIWSFIGLPLPQKVTEDSISVMLIESWLGAWLCHNPGVLPFTHTATYSGENIQCNESLFIQNTAIETFVGRIHAPAASIDDSLFHGLLELPTNFEDLYEIALKQGTCSQSLKAAELPVLCLRCGASFCLKAPCCNPSMRYNKLKAHFKHGCSAPFLSVSSCQLIHGAMLYEETRTLSEVITLVTGEAPYEDSHGETDVGLKRGKPLSLDTMGYRKLEKMYAEGENISFVANQVRVNPRSVLGRRRLVTLEAI